MVLWQPGPELMGKLCGSEEVPHFLFSLSPLCCNIEGAGKGDRTVDLLRTCLGLGGLSQPIPDWSHFIPHLHVHTPSQSRSPGSLKQGHTTSSPVLYQVGIQLSQLTAPRTPPFPRADPPESHLRKNSSSPACTVPALHRQEIRSCLEGPLSYP